MKFGNKGFVFLDDSSKFVSGSELRLDVQKDLTFHRLDNLDLKGSITDFNKRPDYLSNEEAKLEE